MRTLGLPQIKRLVGSWAAGFKARKLRRALAHPRRTGPNEDATPGAYALLVGIHRD